MKSRYSFGFLGTVALCCVILNTSFNPIPKSGSGRSIASRGRVVSVAARTGEVDMASTIGNSPLVTSFGADGIVRLSLGSGGNAVLESLATQTDGKIIAVGSVQNGGYMNTAVVRFTAQGELDTTFGAKKKGYVLMDPSGIKMNSYGHFVYIANNVITVFGETFQTGKKCYGAKSPCNQFAFSTLDLNGNVVKTYAWAANAFGDSRITGISLDDGEKGNVLVTGPACDQKATPYCKIFGMIYNSAGGAWWMLQDDLGVSAIPHAIYMEGSFAYGNLVALVAGEAMIGGKKTAFVARYGFNYNLQQFSRISYTPIDFGGDSSAVALVKDLYGKTLVVAKVQRADRRTIGVVRMNDSFQFDKTYGSNGFAEVSLEADVIANGIWLRSPGNKVMITGTAKELTGPNEKFLAVGLDSSGQLDMTFGADQSGIVAGAAPGTKNTSTSFMWTRDGLLMGGYSCPLPPSPIGPGSESRPIQNPAFYMRRLLPGSDAFAAALPYGADCGYSVRSAYVFTMMKFKM